MSTIEAIAFNDGARAARDEIVFISANSTSCSDTDNPFEDGTLEARRWVEGYMSVVRDHVF